MSTKPKRKRAPRPSPPCPHYEDNQGCCHACGVLMNPDAYDSYYGEGAADKLAKS